LQLWLGKITGGKFQIVPDSKAPQARELSIGNTNRVTENARQKAKETGKYGYVIAADKERVLLLGAGDRSPLYATFALLEEDLGVRWYTASPERDYKSAAFPWATRGEDRFPRQADLSVQIVPREVKPSIPMRSYFSVRYGFLPWAERNRRNGNIAGGYYLFRGVHNFYDLLPPEKYYEKHPEYYSLIKGKRLARFAKEKKGERAQLCLSNPQVYEIIVNAVLQRLRRAPANRHAVIISPNDCARYCECESCKKLEKQYGGVGGMLLWFTAKVAEKVKKEFPDASVGMDLYWGTKQAPPADLFKNVTIPDNVFLRYMLDRGASFSWPYHSMYDDKLTPLKDRTGAADQYVDWTQRENFNRWQNLIPSRYMKIWMYPAQYCNTLAPMPNIRALAETMRFFSERHVDDVFVQPGSVPGAYSSAMRDWIMLKVMWNTDWDVEELLLDFIFGYYEDAAPEVYSYYELLWNNAARYTDFDKVREWIYPIQDEEMYRHDFIPKAYAILERALAKAKSDDVRRRVERIKIEVVYVDCVQLYMQMRDGRTPPDNTRYTTAMKELKRLGDELKEKTVKFYDGTIRLDPLADFVDGMKKVRDRRFNDNSLPNDKWSDWQFRWDTKDEGIAKQWYSPGFAVDKSWHTVKVPAFLARTPAGNGIGYGWYRVSFTLTPAQAARPFELNFGGVDEQAWIYINGKKLGEHSLESEDKPGYDVTTQILWDKPFTIKVKADVLKPGENLLVVRIHNASHNAGIHRPVKIYVKQEEKKDLCDGKIVNEDFKKVKIGEIPDIWNRFIQEANGRVYGIAEVKRTGQDAVLLLSDCSSFVSIWSKSDSILPASKNWVVQFDFQLIKPRRCVAHESGALFGLKQGNRTSKTYLPVVQLDNGAKAGKPFKLIALGEEAAKDLAPNQWYRLAIERKGTTWNFYLDGELKKTVTNRDSELRGYAFGSFRDWRNRLENVELTNFKIGGKTSK
jgi:hypothetical protein